MRTVSILFFIKCQSVGLVRPSIGPITIELERDLAREIAKIAKLSMKLESSIVSIGTGRPDDAQVGSLRTDQP